MKFGFSCLEILVHIFLHPFRLYKRNLVWIVRLRISTASLLHKGIVFFAYLCHLFAIFMDMLVRSETYRIVSHQIFLYLFLYFYGPYQWFLRFSWIMDCGSWIITVKNTLKYQ